MGHLSPQTISKRRNMEKVHLECGIETTPNNAPLTQLIRSLFHRYTQLLGIPLNGHYHG